MDMLTEETIKKLMKFKSTLQQVDDKKNLIESLSELEGKPLYHGTICEYEDVFLKKEKIDVFHGTNGTKDNGFGLYLTWNKEQAYEQGRRKQLQFNLKNKKENRNINTDIMIVEKQINLSEVENFFKNHDDKDYLLYETLEIDEGQGKFILNNRLGKDRLEFFLGEMHNLDNKYALVCGGMADGRIGKLIEEYCDGMTELGENTSRKEYQTKFLDIFLKEINKPLKTGKGSQLSIHDNELFSKALDVKNILKKF